MGLLFKFGQVVPEIIAMLQKSTGRAWCPGSKN